MLEKLRADRAKLVSDMKKLVETAKAENRDMSSEETQNFDRFKSEHDTIVSKIDSEERYATMAGLEKDLDAPAKRSAIEPARPAAATSSATSEPKVWRSLGEQLSAVMEAARPGGRVDPRLSQRAATGLSEGVPSDGGFLVQQDFSTELLKKAYELGQLASRVRRIPISAGANGLKINAIDETSRVDGSRWGGVQAYWVDEAAQKTASKPKFRQIQLNLHKLVGLCYATDELLEDQVAMGSIMTEAFAEEFAFKLDDAIFRGDGAGKPLGILSSGAVVSQAAEGGQAVDTIVSQNVIKMYSRLWPRSRANAVWLANIEIFPQLAQMKLDVGTGGAPVYLPANGLAGQPFDTLMGLPLLFIEQASAIGDVGDIALVDLSQYLAIDKGGVQAASSIHVRFQYDESVFRFVYRVDGQPIWNSALTPYKGAGTLSPFITLAAR